MDFWVPVRTAADCKNRYVLILTDNLPKYVIDDALPNCTTKSAVSFFIDRFLVIHGTPERLITDRRTHFNNHLLHEIPSSMNIAHAFSASYHPQTNGQMECFNATFAAQLSKYCDPNHTDWDIPPPLLPRHITPVFIPLPTSHLMNSLLLVALKVLSIRCRSFYIYHPLTCFILNYNIFAAFSLLKLVQISRVIRYDGKPDITSIVVILSIV